MGYSVMLLAKSGSGKSYTMHDFKDEEIMLIQIKKKLLPFKNDFKELVVEREGGELSKPLSVKGTIIVRNKIEEIIDLFKVASKFGIKRVIVDDLQYMMAGSMFERIEEKGYDKWNDFAKDLYDLIVGIEEYTSDDTIVYLMSHVQTDAQGATKMQTVGQLVDKALTPEGLATIVLGPYRNSDGSYLCQTQQKYGFDTCKSPHGMFESESIPNNLKEIDKKIREYYPSIFK